MKNKPKILSVRIESKSDESPDLSWLGEYSNNKGLFAIDRVAREECGRSEFPYFNPGSVEKFNPDAGWIQGELRIASAVGIKTDAETVWRDAMTNNAEKDYSRMESYNRGDWSMTGIIAKAQIQMTDSSPLQTIRSGGLWGVESDADKDWLKDIAKEQLAELRDELLALGFSKRQIAFAISKHE